MLPSLAQYPGKAAQALPPPAAASTSARVSQKPDCRLGGVKEKFAGMHNMDGWRQINRPLARSSITGINASIPFVSRECDAHPISTRRDQRLHTSPLLITVVSYYDEASLARDS